MIGPNKAPSITAITAKTTSEDVATASIGFTVADIETAVGSLVVTGASSNTALVDTANMAFGGTTGARTLVIAPKANQSGTATITVTVSDGTVTASTSFVLTVTAVNDAPAISSVANQTVTRGVASAALPFTVGDVETAAASLAVTATSSDTTILPPSAMVLGGSGASRTLTITPPATSLGTCQVTVTVSDAGSPVLSATTSFTQTVLANNGSVVLDSFTNGTGGQDLTTRTGEVGSTWTKNTAGGTGSVAMSGAGSAYGTGTGVLLASGVPASANYTVSAQVLNKAPTLGIIGVVGRFSDTTMNGYMLRVNPIGPYLELWKYVAGTPTQLGSTTARIVLPAAGTTKTMELQFEGSTIIGRYDGLTIFSLTDASISQVGRAGIRVASAGTATTGLHLDRISVAANAVVNNQAPTISSLSNPTVGKNSSTGPLPFSVTDAETPAGSLLVTASSSNVALVSPTGLTLGGSGGARTLTVIPLADQSGTATITVTVTDGGSPGLSATSSFVLTVLATNGSIVTDTFTGGTAGQDLTSRAGEVGATWLKNTAGGTGSVAMSGTGSAYGTGTGVLLASGVPASANYTVSAQVLNKAPTLGIIGVVGRFSDTTMNGYMLRVNPIGPYLELWKYVAGTPTQLGSTTARIVLPAAGTTKTMELQFEGSTIIGRYDGSTIFSLTDATISQVGKAGIRVATAGTATTGLHLDAIRVTLSPPMITAQPTNQTVLVGGAAYLSLYATGTPPLSYQWSQSGNNGATWTVVPGGNAASVARSGLTLADNGTRVRCVVSNPSGSVTSATAAITVLAADSPLPNLPTPPWLTSQPPMVAVTPGQAATFQVVSTGTAPLSYQWSRKNRTSTTWTAIAGANAPSYTLPSTSLSDDGALFSCTVSNVAGSATSTTVTLRVLNPPVITTHPAHLQVNEGLYANLNCYATGGYPMVYRWQRWDAAGAAWNDIAGSTNTSSYSLSPVSMAVHHGAQFRCVVSNPVGTVTSNAATVTVTAMAPYGFSVQAENTDKVVVGRSVVLSLDGQVGGTQPITYQWQTRTNPGSTWTTIVGATGASYTTPPAGQANLGTTFSYRCLAFNMVAPGGVPSNNTVSLTVVQNSAPQFSLNWGNGEKAAAGSDFVRTIWFSDQETPNSLTVSATVLPTVIPSSPLTPPTPLPVCTLENQGSGQATLRLHPVVPGQYGSCQVQMTVSDGLATTVLTMTATFDDPTVITSGPTCTPLTPTRARLAVAVRDRDSLASSLITTWSVLGSVPTLPTFSVNKTNNALTSDVTFAAAGDYRFSVKVAGAPPSAPATGLVTYTVLPVFQRMTCAMAPQAVAVNTSMRVVLVGLDQFGAAMPVPNGVVWSFSGAGSIDPDGTYHAPSQVPSANVVITASLTGYPPVVVPIRVVAYATTVAFGQPEVGVYEAVAGASAQIPVYLSRPSQQVVTVPWTISNVVGANAGRIGTRQGTLSIPAGADHGTITIPIVDDSAINGDLACTVTLGVPTNAALGTGQTCRLSVLDDDQAANDQVCVRLTLASPTMSYDVSAGRILVPMTITGPRYNNAQQVVVTYRLAGTAVAGVDYAAMDGRWVVSANDIQSSQLAIPLLRDGLVTAAKTIQVILTGLEATTADVRLGDQRTTLITITDETALATLRTAKPTIVTSASAGLDPITVTMTAPSVPRGVLRYTLSKAPRAAVPPTSAATAYTTPLAITASGTWYVAAAVVLIGPDGSEVRGPVATASCQVLSGTVTWIDPGSGSGNGGGNGTSLVNPACIEFAGITEDAVTTVQCAVNGTIFSSSVAQRLGNNTGWANITLPPQGATATVTVLVSDSAGRQVTTSRQMSWGVTTLQSGGAPIVLRPNDRIRLGSSSGQVVQVNPGLGSASVITTTANHWVDIGYGQPGNYTATVTVDGTATAQEIQVVAVDLMEADRVLARTETDRPYRVKASDNVEVDDNIRFEAGVSGEMAVTAVGIAGQGATVQGTISPTGAVVGACGVTTQISLTMNVSEFPNRDVIYRPMLTARTKGGLIIASKPIVAYQVEADPDEPVQVTRVYDDFYAPPTLEGTYASGGTLYFYPKIPEMNWQREEAKPYGHMLINVASYWYGVPTSSWSAPQFTQQNWWDDATVTIQGDALPLAVTWNDRHETPKRWGIGSVSVDGNSLWSFDYFDNREPGNSILFTSNDSVVVSFAVDGYSGYVIHGDDATFVDGPYENALPVITIDGVAYYGHEGSHLFKIVGDSDIINITTQNFLEVWGDWRMDEKWTNPWFDVYVYRTDKPLLDMSRYGINYTMGSHGGLNGKQAYPITVERSQGRVVVLDNDSNPVWSPQDVAQRTFSSKYSDMDWDVISDYENSFGLSSNRYISSVQFNLRYTRDDATVYSVTVAGKSEKKEWGQLTPGKGQPKSDSPSVELIPGYMTANPSSGNVCLTIPVYRNRGAIPRPELFLTYNSQEGLDHGWGPGWRSNWDIRNNTNQGQYTYDDPGFCDETGRRSVSADDPTTYSYSNGDVTRDTAGGIVSYNANGDWKSGEATRRYRRDGRVLYFDRDRYLVRVHLLQDGRDWTVTRNPVTHFATAVTDSAYSAFNLNLQSTWSGGSMYDAMKTFNQGESGAWTFDYDDLGYMTSVTFAGSGTAAFRFSDGTSSLRLVLEQETITATTYQEGGVWPGQSGGYRRLKSVTYNGNPNKATLNYAFRLPGTSAESGPDGIRFTNPLGATTDFIRPQADTWTRIIDAAGVDHRQTISATQIRRWVQTSASANDGVQHEVITTRDATTGLPTKTERLLTDGVYQTTTYGWNETTAEGPAPAGVSWLTSLTRWNVQGIEGGSTSLIERTTFGTTRKKIGLPITTQDAAGRVTRRVYDTNGLLDRIVGPDGQETEITSDSQTGLVTQTALPGGLFSTMEDLSHSGLPTKVTDAYGYAVTYAYDTFKRAYQTRRPDGAVDVVHRDPLGRENYREDALGRKVTQTYDVFGRLTKRSVASGTADTPVAPVAGGPMPSVPAIMLSDEEWSFEPVNLADQRKGYKTTYTLGGVTQEVTEVDGLGRTVKSTVQRTKVGGSAGAQACTTQWTYDDAGRLKTVTDPVGRKQTYLYDLVGRAYEVTDVFTVPNLGLVTETSRTTYNVLDQILSQTGPDGAVTSMTYTPTGEPARTTNPAGGWDLRTYAITGALSMVSQTYGKPTTYHYDDNGVLSYTVDAFGTAHHQEITKTTTGMTTTTWRSRNNVADNARQVVEQQFTTGIQTSYTKIDGVAQPATTAKLRKDGSVFEQSRPGTPTVRQFVNGLGQPCATTSSITVDGQPKGLVSQTTWASGTGRLQGGTSAWGVPTQVTTSPQGESNGTTSGPVGQAVGGEVAKRDAMGRTLETKTIVPATNGQPQQTLETRWVYDGAGRLASQRGPDGDQTIYRYYPGGRLQSVTRGSRVMAYEYDILGNTTKVTDNGTDNGAFTVTMSGTYDAIGRPLAITTGTDTVTYAYHPDTGVKLTETSTTGIVTQYYDAYGRQTGMAKDGRRMNSTLDALGRITQRIQGATAASVPDTTTTESWTYRHDTSQVDVYTDIQRRRHVHDYDAATGALTAVRILKPLGDNTELSRRTMTMTQSGAPAGAMYGQRIVGSGDAGGSVTRWYSAQARLVEQTVPGSAQESIRYQYDAAGKPIARDTLAYRYDAVGRLQTITQGAQTASLTYRSDNGKLDTLSLPNSVQRIFGYDIGGRLQSISQPSSSGGESWTATRDERGRLTQMTGPQGTVRYAYADNRLVHEWQTGATPASIAYGYDDTDNLTGITQVDGPTTATTVAVVGETGGWTTLGQGAMQGTPPATRTVNLLTSGKLMGSTLSLQITPTGVGAAGGVTVRARNAGGSTADVTVLWRVVTNDQANFASATKGQVVLRQSGQADVTSAWIPCGTNIAATLRVSLEGNGTVLAQATPTAAGSSLKSVSAAVPVPFGSWTVTGLVAEGTAAVQFAQLSWELGSARTTITRQVNTQNQLTTESVAVFTRPTSTEGVTTSSAAYGYDLAGNLTSLVRKSGSTTTQSLAYQYDSQNRLIQTEETVGTPQRMNYTYAAGGLAPLTETTTVGSIAQTVYNRWDNDALVSRTAAGVTTRYGLSGSQPLWEQTGAAPAVTFIRDLQGNVVGRYGSLASEVSPVMNGSGYLTRLSYTGYGAVTEWRAISTNQTLSYTPPGKPLLSGPRYRGGWFNANSGLTRFGARYYSAGMQRFMTMDPARAGGNWYAYCGGDPVNRHDPSGLDWEWVASEQGWRWKANEAAGERQDIIPPEWAVPGFELTGQVAGLYPGGVVPTANALGSRLGTMPDDPATRALAQLVGNGTAGASGWSDYDARTLEYFFRDNGYSNGVEGLSAYKAWANADDTRIMAINAARRSANQPELYIDKERLKIVGETLGEAGVSILPGSGLVQGGMDLSNGSYAMGAVAVGSELPWAKIFKVGRVLVRGTARVIARDAEALGRDAVSTTVRVVDREGAQLVPGRVRSRINIRTGSASEKGSGLEYALKNHGGTGPASKSQFAIPRQDIQGILQRKDVVGANPWYSSDSGNFIREVDVGTIVGNLPKGAGPTTWMTVITDEFGNLVNVFPGKLGRGGTLLP